MLPNRRWRFSSSSFSSLLEALIPRPNTHTVGLVGIGEKGGREAILLSTMSRERGSVRVKVRILYSFFLAVSRLLFGLAWL